MRRRVVLLGNGFDINIGLPTAYRDFINSDFCRLLAVQRGNYVTNRIVNNYRLKNWIDIEEELKTLAIEMAGSGFDIISQIKNEYGLLTDSLSQYLMSISNGDVIKLNERSLAANFLRLLSRFPHDFEIFSFNYTDLGILCKKLNLNEKIPYHHVHGSLKDHNIILGFEDGVDTRGDFSYMIKSFHPAYSSHHIRQVLSSAEEVIFFGMSLGSTDYHYFSQFFNEKSSPGLDSDKSVKISFVTASNQSHIDILEQLKQMNSSNTNLLFDQNEVEFFYANEDNTIARFFYFIRRLELESEAFRILNDYNM